MKAPGKLPLLPLLLALAVLPALFLGSRAQATPAKKMVTYAEILSLIEQRHVPGADSKETIYAGIHGMLNTLDPHTNFLDDEVYREMREEQRGHFYGLGIVIGKRGRHQPLRVVAPIADTPAARLGIRSGDVITHIRDERAGIDIDTLGLTIRESVKHLRGPRGTTVHITIDRPGLDDPIELAIERDAVRTPAVNQAFMVRPGVAYVKIANFTETTVAEFDRAVESLAEQGASRLVLDLKDNPGGLLDQAVQLSSRFLEPGELVVYTEGRQKGSRQDYTALEEIKPLHWPVVVLVDSGSASASEIVAGALQDHDRAIIVGEKTFGKGLVQSVYPLSEGCGLALTTQKYFSPIGRSIQRPYESEAEYYFEVTARENTPSHARPEGPAYLTETGRKVYGGGGITPDILVEEPLESPIVIRLRRASAFTRFVDPLSPERRSVLDQDDEALLKAFAAFVDEEVDGIEGDELAEARDGLLLNLKGEFALSRGGLRARERLELMRNPVVLRGLDAFGEAEALLGARVAVLSKRASLESSP